MNYVVNATALTPITLGAQRDSSKVSTLDYLSGSTFFGTFAANYALLHPDTTALSQLFFDDETRFSNLYPAQFGQYGLQKDSLAAVYPLPKSAASCKRFKGFRGDGDGDQDPRLAQPHHGVYDQLIPWTLFALSDQKKISILEENHHCHACREPLYPFEGFYRRSRADLTMGLAKIPKGIRTRTGIDRATGAVQQGILYNREMIQADTQFWGQMIVPDEFTAQVGDFIAEANELGLVRFGNNRSRGLGRVDLALIADKHPPTQIQLEQRIQSFDQKLREVAEKHEIATPHPLYISLTLTSDAIILDPLLRYYTSIQPAYLQQAFGIEESELIYQHCSTHPVAGWNSIWKVPKPDQKAITKGSVFVFGLNKALDDPLLETLWRLEQTGIGTRQREGFGQVLISSPFHWEVNGQ